MSTRRWTPQRPPSLPPTQLPRERSLCRSRTSAPICRAPPGSSPRRDEVSRRVCVRQKSAAPFSGYLTEILAVEGFLGYEAVDLTGRLLTADLLDGQELVLLSQMPLDASEQQALDEYVHRGGRLFALRPPTEMAALFGLKAQGP